MTLDELALKYGADKASNQHGYMRMYEKLFKTIDIKSLLEIGLLSGKSMRTWREYLPEVKLYSMELPADKRENPDYNGEDISGLTVFVGNSTKEEAWKEVPYNLDVIIDDGSHLEDDQLMTFLLGFKHVASHGLYFIEDTHAPFLAGRATSLVYELFFRLLMTQQKVTDNTEREWSFEGAREHMDELTAEIYSYHAYKSIVVFEKY